MGFSPLLPDPAGLSWDRVQVTPDHITVMAKTTAPAALCPVCGTPSRRVHSRYIRILNDLPWLGAPVRLVLQVRRFFCGVAACPRVVFTERLPHVAATQCGSAASGQTGRAAPRGSAHQKIGAVPAGQSPQRQGTLVAGAGQVAGPEPAHRSTIPPRRRVPGTRGSILS